MLNITGQELIFSPLVLMLHLTRFFHCFLYTCCIANKDIYTHLSHFYKVFQCIFSLLKPAPENQMSSSMTLLKLITLAKQLAQTQLPLFKMMEESDYAEHVIWIWPYHQSPLRQLMRWMTNVILPISPKREVEAEFKFNARSTRSDHESTAQQRTSQSFSELALGQRTWYTRGEN